MIAIEVSCNGAKVVLAGSEALEGGMIGASVDVPDTCEDKVLLTVFGVTKYVEGEQQRVLYWKERMPFSVGDEIRIRAIPSSVADPHESESDPLTEE
ncbi:hypothetical protein [Nibricoccus aquaticus]|nr:hypothetical protein [Nibricoccus aquaticus]